LHKNNLHNDKYNFGELIKSCDALKPFVFENEYNTQTIDFSNPQAVKLLNKALLFNHYKITFWEFPDENLCPPIPSRADYMHHLTDLLRRSNLEKDCKILDIGTGATCIYPLLGHAIKNWSFVGTDIDTPSLQTAQIIIEKNKLTKYIELRLQKDTAHILNGIIRPSDKFCASMCNPPFFKTEEDALDATKTKLKGLGKQTDKVVRNFSGTSKELSYKGGEKAFLHTYLYESTHYKKQCFWFTSLVSNVSHVKSMQASLEKLGATDIQVIDMIQGNKVSRVVAWTFLTKEEQKDWNA
jgi:23S rRNA (adenine1618-N6)-methyltransferase